MKSNRLRRWLFPAVMGIVLLAVVVAVAVYFHQMLYVPVKQPGAGEEIEFTIERGEKLDSIAARLHRAGILRDPAALKLAAFFGGGGKGVKAGTHRLRTDLSAWSIYQLIQQSPLAEFVRLVIPEGFDTFEIAQRLAELGICGEAQFFDAVSNPATVSVFAPGANTLEGYLFPDTYHVPVGAGAGEVVEMMLKRFREKTDAQLNRDIEAAGFSLQQGVILASLIAREAGNAEEMPLISSVFHNRLRIGMKLDCDPTFIYARKQAGDWDGVVLAADRQIDSPYNTYRTSGLPPGPIGSPGREALRAAAHPADSEFLYFVAKGPDTSLGHYFSRTAAEHSRAVARYRREVQLARQRESGRQ